MTNNTELVDGQSGLVDGQSGLVPNSLQTLADYLELSLDKAASIVMLRDAGGVCMVYLGDPSGQREDLNQIATIDASLANEMLELTRSGANHMVIGSQDYRFVRSFTTVGVTAAIVFSTD